MTSSVICDYLDITSKPDSAVCSEVIDFVTPYVSDVRVKDHATILDFEGSGTMKVEKRSTWSRVSASGSVLSLFRALSIFDNYLSLLGSHPHRVTRLDAACDFSGDFADLLPKLRRKFSHQKVKLTQKSLPVTYLTSRRESDNRETGTFYAGRHRKARVSARVYDKSQQMSDVHGIDIPPTIRYELTVRSEAGASLRDASEPDSIFWHFMSPSLLKIPPKLSPDPWEPDRSFNWESVPLDSDPAATLVSSVNHSAWLDHMASVADKLGPNGRRFLLREISKRIGVDLD